MKVIKCSAYLVELLFFDCAKVNNRVLQLVLYLSYVTTLSNYATFVVKDHGCYLCRCLDICLHVVVALCGRQIWPLLNSSQRTYCSSQCFTTQAVIYEVLFVATQVENDSWLWRRIGMFCILRLQVILVKSSMRLSSTTFSIVDIVGEGIQESKGTLPGTS